MPDWPLEFLEEDAKTNLHCPWRVVQIESLLEVDAFPLHRPKS
jgi:hypothetical protein